MTPVFLDSGAIYAFINRNDVDHAAVVDAYRDCPHIVTHTLILDKHFRQAGFQTIP